MAELLSVPFKKTSNADIVKPLTNLISSTYRTADNPEDYNEQINELNKLRTTAVWRALEKFETSLELNYNYYDQLQALETKIPPQDVQIPFKWKDAFNKPNFFGGTVSLTLSSLSYERVCVLFNIAALQSGIAAIQVLDNDEGLKLAAKLFQQSAGIFDYLKNTVAGAIQVEPTPDLSAETLSALSALMVSQGQEVFVHKAIHDRMKDGIITKLASQCEEYYAEALKLLQKDTVRNLVDKDWITLVAGKQAAFHGLAEYYQSLVCKEKKEIGEQIARLMKALELIKSAQARSGRTTLFQEYIIAIERELKEAQKDNNFIYHERVPDPKLLSAIPRAPLAKPTPMPHRLSSNFKDLFEGLLPVPVHQALAAFYVRKSELVIAEISDLRQATQLLNAVLASLNLPAALEETTGEAIPQSICDKSTEVNNLGGIAEVERMICYLPELVQRNTEMLDEAQRMLVEEENSDKQLRNQFKDEWKRMPSEKLTKTFNDNIQQYKNIISVAINADKAIKDKFESNRKGIQLLTNGLDAMRREIPCATSASGNSAAATRLRELMVQVETMKAERDAIEMDLKSTTVEMKDVFMEALAKNGTINEPALSTEALGKAYGRLQQQVKDSKNEQQNILAKIQEENSKFSGERNEVGGSQRDTLLKELATAHAVFIELLNHLKEGSKFYNDLTSLLVAIQNKITDFCFARKTEKEELLKDLTLKLSQTAPMTASDVPTVPNVGVSNTPAPGPSQQPIQSSAPVIPPVSQPGNYVTLPYPMAASAMPMPYAPYGSLPYPPAPMPVGYNPYATIAGYPHRSNADAYQYQGQVPPPMQYPGQHPYPQQQYQKPWL